MAVTIRYETLLKRAAGTSSEAIELPASQNVHQVVRSVAARHGEPLCSMVIDAEGNVRPTVLVFVGDTQITSNDSHAVCDGDVITLMSPISGG